MMGKGGAESWLVAAGARCLHRRAGGREWLAGPRRVLAACYGLTTALRVGSGRSVDVCCIVVLSSMVLGTSLARAEEQTGIYRLLGLSAAEREAELREVMKAVPDVALVRLDAAQAEVTLRFDPEKLNLPTKAKQPPTAEKITERLSSLLGQASKNTFTLTARSTVPADKLTTVEIPIGVLDCKGCRYAAYQAVAKLDGVERATVSAKPSAIIAWIDATKTKREALEEALKKARVELVNRP